MYIHTYILSYTTASTYCKTKFFFTGSSFKQLACSQHVWHTWQWIHCQQSEGPLRRMHRFLNVHERRVLFPLSPYVQVLCYDFCNGHLCKHVHRVYSLNLMTYSVSTEKVANKSSNGNLLTTEAIPAVDSELGEHYIPGVTIPTKEECPSHSTCIFSAE